jgi:acyl dehydratase
MSSDHGWYFDDFEVGQVHTTMGRTVTEADVVNFVTFGGIFEEIFINAEYAQSNSLFKGRVAPFLLTLVFAEGLYVQSGHTHKGRAFLGLEDLRMTAPVFCGDTIHVEVSVESARTSNGRPGNGILTMAHKVVNQNDVQVMSYRTTRMLACRPADDGAAPQLASDGLSA